MDPFGKDVNFVDVDIVLNMQFPLNGYNGLQVHSGVEVSKIYYYSK